MASPSSLADAIAELPVADRVIVSALADAIDQLAATTLQLTEACAILNELDDRRAAAIAELRDELHALQGERASVPDAAQLAELIAAYTAPAPASLRAADPEPDPAATIAGQTVYFPTARSTAAAYHAEVQRLRARLAESEGGGEGA